MGYTESLLADGERIIVRERRHWLAVPLDSRWAILSLVVAGVLVFLNLDGTVSGPKGTIGQLLGWVILILVVAGIAWIVWTTWNWWNEDYLITNRRVVKVEGVLNKHAADSSLEKINDAELDQNFVGRAPWIRRPGHPHGCRDRGRPVQDVEPRGQFQAPDAEPEA
jgi:hypothetical protein